MHILKHMVDINENNVELLINRKGPAEEQSFFSLYSAFCSKFRKLRNFNILCFTRQSPRRCCVLWLLRIDFFTDSCKVYLEQCSAQHFLNMPEYLEVIL